MKKYSLFFALLLLASCTSPELADNWTPDKQGPWDGSLYSSSSEDGLHFTGRNLVLNRAGVPHLLQLQNGDLVLTYQYFSDTDRDMFDVISYSISSDAGATWTEPSKINFAGLPDTIDGNKRPMDPTLVQLEDGRLRLYFTYHAEGRQSPELYSATTGDDQIGSAFEVNPEPALSVPGENLLDPAVTYFNGMWQHYTWIDGEDVNYHSTSSDGLSFTLQDDVELPMDFLGQVIPFGEGLRFYGTGQGVTTAYSADGVHWEIDGEQLVPGADPGVQKLADGTYFMVYTSMNFN